MRRRSYHPRNSSQFPRPPSLQPNPEQPNKSRIELQKLRTELTKIKKQRAAEHFELNYFYQLRELRGLLEELTGAAVNQQQQKALQSKFKTLLKIINEMDAEYFDHGLQEFLPGKQPNFLRPTAEYYRPLVITDSVPMLRKMILELRYERSLCRCVELRREIEGYRKDVKDFRSQIEEMREVYEGRVREQEEEINRLRLEIMEKDEEIGRLLKNIEEGSTGRDTGRGPGRSVGETDRRSNEQPGNQQQEPTSDRKRIQQSPPFCAQNKAKLYRLLQLRIEQVGQQKFNKFYQEPRNILQALDLLCSKRSCFYLDLHQGIELLQHFYGRKLSLNEYKEESAKEFEKQTFKQKLQNELHHHFAVQSQQQFKEELVNVKKWLDEYLPLIKSDVNVRKQMGLERITKQEMGKEVEIKQERIFELIDYKNFSNKLSEYACPYRDQILRLISVCSSDIDSLNLTKFEQRFQRKIQKVQSIPGHE